MRAPATSATVTITGGTASDTVDVMPTAVTADGSIPLSYNHVTLWNFALGSGADQLTVDAANIQIGSAGISASTMLTIINGAILDLGGNAETVAGLTLQSGTLRNGTLSPTTCYVQSGVISANLTGAAIINKTTAGTLTLSGTNSNAGGIVVAAGEAIIANVNAIGNGANLTVGDADAFAAETVDASPLIASPTAGIVSAANGPGAAPAQAADAISGSEQTMFLARPSQTANTNAVETGPVSTTVENAELQSAKSNSTVSAVATSTDHDRGTAVAAVLGKFGPQAKNAAIARRYAGEVAWLAATVNASQADDQRGMRDFAIQALDAALAEYGA